MGYQKEEVYDGNDGYAHVVQVYRRLDCRCVANTTTFLSIKLENIMVESNDLVTIETETHRESHTRRDERGVESASSVERGFDSDTR